MTVEEISNRIDIILNKGSKGLAVDEYVKSLYMTSAQALYVEEVLAAYEYGDKIRHILGNLLVTASITNFITITKGEYTATLANNVKQIVYEVTDSDIATIPLDWNDIHYTLENPFRKPDSKISYRTTDNKSITLYTEVLPISYKYVYCKIPEGIVLENLPANLEVQGETNVKTSELPEDTVLRIIDICSKMILRDKLQMVPKKSVPSESNKENINN